MNTFAIRQIQAQQILDSRGNPTLAVAVHLGNGAIGEAMVPSGASTGTHEAVELRDADPRRYGGKGVLRAASHVEGEITRAITGMDARDQAAIDRRMIDLDGTTDKSRLGANAILGVSCAVARAAAGREPLWKYLAGDRLASIPVPMANILSGGLHAGKNFEFQDFLVIPRGFAMYAEALEAIVAVHRAARAQVLEEGFLLTGVADEGGWGPRLPSNEAALRIVTQSIERAGFLPGEQFTIAIDVASTHFFRDGQYHLESENRVLSSAGMTDLLDEWVRRYPVTSIEDGLAEDDWAGWKTLTARLGKQVQLIGDDLFTTNLARLERGIREHVANAVLVKMNQIGTLTETLAVIDRAREAGYRAVISARSGETEDSFLADLAVASGAGQIKIGSITRSERLAKYNRLLWIERDLLISRL
jgi:enolase